MGEADHKKAFEKTSIAESECSLATKKINVWKHQKKSLLAQVFAMKKGFSRPIMKPSPLPYTAPTLEQTSFLTFLEVEICAFCGRGFEHAWDCKIASCKHGYHSWCAFTHFSSSNKCLIKTCEKKMHADWWTLAGIQKPCEYDVGDATHTKGASNGQGFDELEGNIQFFSFFKSSSV